MTEQDHRRAGPDLPGQVIKRLGPKKPLGEEVYDTLKKAILQGTLQPGRRLIEAQLAESLGASRTPVRQAIHKLEQENLVERQDRGGFLVKALSLEDIEEIFDLRSLLEAYAARQAAEKITPEKIRFLQDKNEAFRQALENKTGDLAALNTEFHEALYGFSGNRRLQRIIHDLHDHFYRYRVILLKIEAMARTSYEDHRAMIEAMTAGDPDRTERLVRRHILKGKEAIKTAIRRGGLELM